MPDLSPDVERELAALDDALAGRRVPPDLTDLGELALLLRDERAQPDPRFAADLDRAARLGFPKGGPSPGARRQRRKRIAWPQLMVPALATTFLVGLLALVIALPGDLGSDDEEAGLAGGGSSGSAPMATEADSARDSAGGEEAASAGDEAQSLAPAPPADDGGAPGRANRAIERSASLTLAAPPRAIDSVSDDIQSVTRRHGGFVASSSVRSSQEDGGGSFLLRIPTRNLAPAISELSQLGAVRESSHSQQDITAQRVSARSRLADARTERKSLLAQLADADTVQETESIRARLRLVSAEIERARAEVRRVSNRANFATVSVTLVADRGAAAPGEEDEGGAWTPADAWDDALRVLEVIAGVALIVLAVALPLALVGAAVAVALGFARRRRREHALDAV